MQMMLLFSATIQSSSYFHSTLLSIICGMTKKISDTLPSGVFLSRACDDVDIVDNKLR